MIVKTINPVTINRKRISKPSEYLSANGEDEFYGFDANGKPQTKDETKQFQNWLDSKYPTWLNGGKLNGGVGYGTFGPSTTKAWGTYGSEFAKTLKTGTPSATPTAEPTKDEAIAKAKLGQIWDKNKGWITSDKSKEVLKVLLGGGSVMDAINSLLGGGSGGGTTNDTTTTTTTTETTKEGLSKNAKIGIAVGIVALFGIIIYAVTRPKTNN